MHMILLYISHNSQGRSITQHVPNWTKPSVLALLNADPLITDVKGEKSFVKKGRFSQFSSDYLLLYPNFMDCAQNSWASQIWISRSLTFGNFQIDHIISKLKAWIFFWLAETLAFHVNKVLMVWKIQAEKILWLEFTSNQIMHPCSWRSIYIPTP